MFSSLLYKMFNLSKKFLYFNINSSEIYLIILSLIKIETYLYIKGFMNIKLK